MSHQSEILHSLIFGVSYTNKRKGNADENFMDVILVLHVNVVCYNEKVAFQLRKNNWENRC